MKTLIYLSLIITSLSAYASNSPEVLYLDPSDDVSLDEKGTPKKFFLISNSLHDGRLGIRNEADTIVADLKCDGEKNRKLKLKKNKTKEVYISQAINNCILSLGENKAIRLIKDEVAFPMLKDLHRVKESCQYQTAAGTPISQQFLTNNYPIMSCAHEADKIDILTESEDGLLAKMEALLGYKPAVEFIYNQNPYAELDFSRAPKLDAIFVSTLLYRHDFSGTVLARLLKFHAERGALINIVGTGYMHEDKDKALLKELSLTSGNIRIQEYKYHDPRWGIKPVLNALTNYLRDMHVKMFVTLSSTNPENNVLIMGGRNVHDGFVFATKPDLSKYPELDQFDPKADYAYWNDLEIKITSTKLARSVYAHLLKFWNREVVGQKTEDIQEVKAQAQELSGEEVLSSQSTMIRHVLTLPFNDDHALEKLYVEMIDKASTSIKLSSPYLRPTKAIMDAFQRAIERKVDITIQTRIDLKGDTQAWLYEETNKAAINSLFDKVKIFEWTENSILHTKLLIIDDNFAFFGSVNLSRRSFIQDVENGFMIHDVNFVSKMTQIFDGYNERSQLINKKQKRKFWASIFVNLFQNQF
ncbi:MAG: phosphatidylserine/phosphatidylglycerophosphate/cardiolipin synthase family protein [Bacteriovoracaceae bacterium]|nr:phosphatidylserine/phosphatidylglycerophosphate/cardiolipin synthase family protein [Bacteriovoracaceae bacterium]